jgi:hypothetical protein
MNIYKDGNLDKKKYQRDIEKPWRNIYDPNDHIYAPFVVITGFVAIVARHMSLAVR